jgi:hypothetical protein
MSDPKGDKKQKGGRPATKTIEPPSKKSSEQVPAGDDSDIHEGNDPEQRADAEEESTAEKDKESRSDENSGYGF